MVLSLGKQKFDEASEIKYLGSTLTQNGRWDREIILRIAYAGAIFSQLNNNRRFSKYFLKLKLCLFNSNVTSILNYGWECWSLSRAVEKRLLGFENNCLQTILAICWADRVPNTRVQNSDQAASNNR